MSAARLCSMGIDPEAVRDRLRQSAEQGAPCNCGEMRQAVQDFKELDIGYGSTYDRSR